MAFLIRVINTAGKDTALPETLPVLLDLGRFYFYLPQNLAVFAAALNGLFEESLCVRCL